MTVQTIAHLAAESLEKGGGAARLAGVAVEALERPAGGHVVAGVAVEILADVVESVPGAGGRRRCVVVVMG